jgi:putative hydrolase of the HAD superfamily
MNDLRVIFFDAAGTLIDLPRGAAHHYCEVARRHGWMADQQTVDEAFRRTWRDTPAPPTTRMPREDDDRGWWRAFVDRVLDRCAAPSDSDFDRDAYFAELYDEFTQPGVWDVFPETRPALARLAERFTLGIISNFDRRLRWVLEELDLAPFFLHVVISSEVGADKPDPWIFEQALRRAELRPAQALHVGDEPAADWVGAEKAGLHVFRLKRPEHSLEHLVRLLE